jgi:hypothetical protein
MRRFVLSLALVSLPLAAQTSIGTGPWAAVSDTSVVEPSSGSTPATFTIAVSPHAQAVTVSYATADGSATAGADYTAASGSVTFQPGETTKTVSVDVLADATQSANEAFTLTLTQTSAGSIVRANGTCTILLSSAGGLRGDANGDGVVDVRDVFYLANALFAGGAPPASTCLGDANDDGLVDVRDIFYLVNYLFAHGPAPSPSGC